MDQSKISAVFIIRGALTGVFIATCFWVIDLLFLEHHQKRQEAGISRKTWWFTRRKMIALSVMALTSGGAGALLALYGCDVYALLSRIIALNILCFLAWMDKRERIVPNRYLLVILGITVSLLSVWSLYLIGTSEADIRKLWISALLGSVVCFGCLAFGAFLSHGGIGAGDIKLMGIIGLLLGVRCSYLLIILAMLIAAAYSVIQLIRQKLTMKSQLPFVPFLAAAMIVITYVGV